MTTRGGDPGSSAALLFSESFGAAPHGVWAAPGRVNLVGEHVDYNAGLCLPFALSRRTAAAVRLRDDDRLRLVSSGPVERWEGRLGDVGPGAPSGWAAYAAGVVWALREAGADVRGVDVAVASDVPVGAGLSSSAALECSVALAVAELTGAPTDTSGRGALAAACVRAENEVAGAPTGGMDQAVALHAREGHALLLDCRDGSHEHVPLDLDAEGLALLVVDTRAAHRLVDGQYAERRATCQDAARRLGVASLRELAQVDEPAQVDPTAHLDDTAPIDLTVLADDVQRRRVRHVVTEIARVRRVADLLRAGRAADCGPLLDASHDSLRDDYEVSSPELDAAVDAARSSGALGARMTGGGFGGSAIALLRAGDVEPVRDAVRDAFSQRGFGDPGFLLARPGAGARRVV